jgi:ABC-type transport system involved in cytochrome c biogenesis permease subunit
MTALPLILYVAASAAYVAHFASRNRRLGVLATGTLTLAALVHTFVIGMRTMEVGHVPFVGTAGAVSAFVWLLALAYLYTEMSTNERAIGTFIVPLVALMQVIPTFATQAGERPAVLESPLFAVHVSSMLFAYASFALACVIGVTYVLLFKEIKAKHLGVFYARLPPLKVLDVMNRRAVTIGWLFLTMGVIVGGAWASTSQVQNAPDPRLQAMTILDPKIFVALVCWVVYSFELLQWRRGWSGRRTAMLSALGFAIVLLNFVPVGFFLTRSHNF